MSCSDLNACHVCLLWSYFVVLFSYCWLIAVCIPLCDDKHWFVQDSLLWLLSETKSETNFFFRQNFFSTKSFLIFFLGLNFVSDFVSDYIPQLYFTFNHLIITCVTLLLKLSEKFHFGQSIRDKTTSLYVQWWRVVAMVFLLLTCRGNDVLFQKTKSSLFCVQTIILRIIFIFSVLRIYGGPWQL